MKAKIQPVSLFKFGTADTLDLRLISDDLTASAQFFWQLGRTIPGTPATPETNDDQGNTTAPAVPGTPETFQGADNVIGNATIAGDNYKGWDGTNDAALDLILPQIDPMLKLA